MDKESISSQRCAIISGVTGQDGSFLSDILLEKGYKVIGLSRRRSGGGDGRIKHLLGNENFILEFGDVTDSGSLHRIIDKYAPDYFFNLAAQSFVGLSWNEPVHTANATAIGVLNCLEAIRDVKKDTKFYQASSSEMFGKVAETPQCETTPFYPRSPYGVSKLFGYWITRNYRESYGMFATNGILFNHESPRRGIEFVTKKITKAAAEIYVNRGGTLALGNLDSVRDFGHAKDYMEAAWLMLQHDKPDDFVISTGVGHTIKDLLDTAFGYLNLDWRQYVVQDPRFMRPAEVDLLLGDSTKAREILGWKPKYDFKTLIEEMVRADLNDTSPSSYETLMQQKAFERTS